MKIMNLKILQEHFLFCDESMHCSATACKELCAAFFPIKNWHQRSIMEATCHIFELFPRIVISESVVRKCTGETTLKMCQFCADTSTVKKQKHSCLGPTLDVVMRARDRQLNWPGHIDRLEEHRVIRQVLIDRVKPTPDSIFGDVPDLLSREAAE